VEASALLEMVDRLSVRQPTFVETGGVHAAGVYHHSGGLLACHEDIGRHNAVDKVVGALVFDSNIAAGGEKGPVVLAVSGRSSFEIVQKAAMARIPIVASVSAASSLAIDLAHKLRITLVGFVRGKGFNIYSHPDRVRE